MATHDEIPIDMFSTLPEDISNDICSRIPAKSVGKFRCLSKTWNTRLSTKHFINLHLSRNTHQQSLLLLNLLESVHVIKLPIENPTVSKELELENTYTKLVGSCNGLVLLLKREEMFLVNPTTLEQFNVPELDITFERNKFGSFYGFGYDSSTDDYKILVLTVYGESESESGKFPSYHSKVDLYSVKSGFWRRINDYMTDYAICGCSCGAYANDSIHYLVKRVSTDSSPFAILAFNLTTLVFNEIEIPPKPDLFCRDTSCRVFTREGRLCTLDPLSTEKIHVWMMTEYGMLDSWIKLGCVNKREKWHMCVPLCFSSDGEIVLINRETNCAHPVRRMNGVPLITITYNHTMVVYNLQEGTVKDMVVNGVPASFGDGFSYVDSLVSHKVIASSS